ncbi:MAG: glycine cleavage system protein GcvH [Planctomycetia bacterium]|nr:glycine cleavage system protein GcvH [Candidatus Brocadia sp.]QOJ05732.1 MAG: glycine cleavage system protein GcvH [Planctomycetia bacterium]TVL95003.1 MAG: glycine cleavage system protein H [Candidatus Brocadia sp. BL1]HQU31184.1 glycine cleavage system protein GcvH [Candidatus Brocadia sapporoensis]
MTNIPNELFYTKTHEWVKKISQNVVIMGITAHAQEQLRDIVFVELPSLGKELKAGEACAVVESVKAAYDIFSPLSGKVIKINEKIQEKPQRVNEDPYGEGWFLHIEISDPNEFNALLSQAQYQAICKPAP